LKCRDVLASSLPCEKRRAALATVKRPTGTRAEYSLLLIVGMIYFEAGEHVSGQNISRPLSQQIRKQYRSPLHTQRGPRSIPNVMKHLQVIPAYAHSRTS
jgi:hypothetical protein